MGVIPSNNVLLLVFQTVTNYMFARIMCVGPQAECV